MLSRNLARPVAEAALFCFVCVLACGTFLLLTAKLQVPDLGAGASPWSILEAIAIVSFGALGVPVDVGELQVSALPLGALAVVGLAAASGIRRSFVQASTKMTASETEERTLVGASATGESRVRSSAVVGLALGFLCLGASLTMVPGESDVSVHPVAAFLAGWFWGSAWAVAGLWGFGLRKTIAWLRRRPTVRGAILIGAREGARLAAWVTLLALGSVVVFGLWRLATAVSLRASLGTFVHGLAFGPNLASAAVALGLGGEIRAGFGGSIVAAGSGEPPAYALFGWHGSATPMAAWLLPLIPLVCILAMGARFARLNPSPAEGESEVSSGWRILPTMLVTSFVFAAALGLLAVLGRVRAVLDMEEGGWATVAPDPLQVVVLGLGWAAVGLPLGWVIGRVLRRMRGPATHEGK